MKIIGFQESSSDYPGKYSLVIFTPKCNYQCPACHAKKILNSGVRISKEEIFSYLDSKKDWIEGVVLCGGEPTLEMGLIRFARELKERGLLVKLDTNGSNYAILQELKKENLIDYVAMDVKAPPYLYPKIAGREYIDLRDDVEKGMGVVSQFPDYEFRTTVVPIARKDDKINFMNIKEIGDIAEFIYESTGSNKHKYFLQPFVARTKEEMIDERFGKENLPKEMHETPKELLGEYLAEARKYLPNCEIRA